MLCLLSVFTLPSPALGYSELTSWYGPGFEYQYTASGDVFEPAEFTCASMDYPFGTVLGITYRGAYAECVVTDTGAFEYYGRGLDLSQGIAEYIGLASYAYYYGYGTGPDVDIIDVSVVSYGSGELYVQY